jgi:hypothetical protein
MKASGNFALLLNRPIEMAQVASKRSVLGYRRLKAGLGLRLIE